MTQNELRNVARVTNTRYRSTMRDLGRERTKVSILSIRIRSLKDKLFEFAKRKDVYRFCKDVSDQRAFKIVCITGVDFMVQTIR